MAEQVIVKDIPHDDASRIQLEIARWMQKGRGGLGQLTHAYPIEQVLTPEQRDAFYTLRTALDNAVAVFHTAAQQARTSTSP
jgi:hypothetical protein